MKSDAQARTNASNYENQIVLRDDVTRQCEEERLDKVFGEGVGSCAGCLEVEIFADYGNRAGLFVTELWESLEAHSEQSSALWGTERVDIWEACRELALIEANWAGAIVLKSEKTG